MDTTSFRRCRRFIGATLALWYIDQGNTRNVNPNDDMKSSYLGTEFDDKQIEQHLLSVGANFKKLSYEEIIDKTSEYLSDGKAIGWFQGEWNLVLEP